MIVSKLSGRLHFSADKLILLVLLMGMLLVIGWFYALIAVLILLQVELCIIIYRYLSTGWLCPGAILTLKMLEYDDLMGFNLTKNFLTESLWKGSERKRKKLEKHKRGLGNYISTNALRYRGRPTVPQKSSNVCRIIVLGDSTTFGSLVDDDFTWPSLFEKELNRLSKGSPHFEVLNLSVGGYRFEQIVQRYLRDYLEYDVDIVINSSFINDFKYAVIYESHAYKGLNKSNKNIKEYFSQKRSTRYTKYIWDKSVSRVLLKNALVMLSRLLKKEKNSNSLMTSFSRPCVDYSINHKQYRRFYEHNCQWNITYRNYFDILYKQVKEKHPSCIFYLVCAPVLMSNHDYYNDPANYLLPESLSFDLRNGRSYHSSRPESVERNAMYLAHSKLFGEFLIDMSDKYGDCKVIKPYESICNVPFEERHTIFSDEFHLTNLGNLLFGKEIAANIWVDLKCNCNQNSVSEKK